MKGKKNRSLSRKLGIRKTQVGRLDAGTVFLHQDDFWIVLNRSMSGGKLVRTLIGDYHSSLILTSETEVEKVISIKKFNLLNYLFKK